MDFIKIPSLLAATFIMTQFWAGCCEVLAASGIPHSAKDAGAALTTAVIGIVSWLLSLLAQERIIRRRVNRAVAQHLAPVKDTASPAKKLLAGLRRAKRNRPQPHV